MRAPKYWKAPSSFVEELANSSSFLLRAPMMQCYCFSKHKLHWPQ